MLEKRRRFRPFHPPPYGIHDSTADRTTALIETKPIRQVELAGDSGDLYPRITQLEEPLLEDHTQDFVAQQPRRALLAQRRPEQIAARAIQEFPLARDLREFEQVQRAVQYTAAIPLIHMEPDFTVQGRKARMRRATGLDIVLLAVRMRRL